MATKTKDQKIQEYNELQADISNLVMMKNKTPKQMEKLTKMYDKQDKQLLDSDVMEYIHYRFAQNG